MKSLLQIRPSERHLLPHEPGIYKMLDAEGDVLYVGKAKNLKKRVQSYFIGVDKKDIKTQHLVANIANIEVTVTHDEAAAFQLEKKLIKTLQPRYNIALKDDKNYPLIKITTQEPFPRILITRDQKKDGATYFGPYASIGSSKSMLRALGDIFPIRDCSQEISLDTPEPKCINLDIGKCIGPCIYKTVKAQYDSYIADLKLFLCGKNRQLITQMTQEMAVASQKKDYEKAAQIRDRLQTLEKLIQKRQSRESTQTIQLWVTVEDEKQTYVLMQAVVEGVLLFQRGFYHTKQESPLSKTNFLEHSFLETFDQQSVVPEAIYCDEILHKTIKAINKDNPIHIPIHCPQKGEKKQWIDTTTKNAKLALFRLKKGQETKQKITQETLDKMKVALSLKNTPKRIWGIDISHLSGQDIVASTVAFLNGKPDKAHYRYFAIKSLKDKSNDPQSIYETLNRRIKLSQKEGGPWPDLILIDGGKAQLNFALKALAEHPDIPPIDCRSLAKKNEEIYSPNADATIQLSRRDPILKVLQQVRDESHRFSRVLQEKKRHSRIKKSVLLEIPGIGIKRLNEIYKAVKSLENIKKTSEEDLAKIGNMGPGLAKKVKELVGKLL